MDIQAQLKDADLRAGRAERLLQYEIDAKNARTQWLDKAKKQWGVDINCSFDKVWAECLELKRQQLAQQPSVDVLVEALRNNIKLCEDANARCLDQIGMGLIDIIGIEKAKQALAAYQAKPINESLK